MNAAHKPELDYKALFARELTRANALERECNRLRDTLKSRTDALEAVTELADLRAAEIAILKDRAEESERATSEWIDRHLTTVEMAQREDRRLHQQIRLLECDIRDLRETLGEVLENDAVGDDCGTCNGSGKVRDERDCFSDRIGHYTVPGDEYECEDCYGGRVQK